MLTILLNSADAEPGFCAFLTPEIRIPDPGKFTLDPEFQIPDLQPIFTRPC